MKKSLFILTIIIIILPMGGFSQESFKIEKLPFNTRAFDELSAVPYQKGLVFTSSRRKSILSTHTDAEKGTPVNNLWFAERTEDGKWKAPRIFSEDLESIFHDGPAAFNLRGNLIYFTRSMEGPKNINKTLGIFIAEKSGTRWIRTRAFPYNSQEYNLVHPSINADGTKLFFASDMPGGYGGMDIYMSVNENGQWSQPVNLGPSINSSSDEAFPSIHFTGRLFFSSKGHQSNGGFDIFYTDRFNDSWLNPVRLEEPFNSPFDDFGYVADAEFQIGYFTSNREKSDNIYRFRNLNPQFKACNEIEENNYCFIFWEETGHIDPEAFQVEWDLGDGTILKGVEVEHCYKGVGDYDISLNVIDAITGNFQYREASYLLSLKDIEQVVITSPDSCFVNEEIKLDGFKTYLPNTKIEEYYWDFGDGNKAVGISQQHKFQRPGLYRVILGITAFPDINDVIEQKCSYKIIKVVDR